jgi:hypothetical protein
MLMGGSPMYQEKKKDPYSGKTFRELGSEIENFAAENKKRIASEMVAKSDSTSAANNAMKLDKTLSKKMAGRIGNEAANKTRSEKKIPRVNRGKYTDGGYMTPSKFGDTYDRQGQLERDFPTSLVTAFRKASPTRQMSKLKSGKSPAKQVSKMPSKSAEGEKTHQDRMGKMTTADRERIKTGSKRPEGRSLDKNGTAARPKADKKAPMKMKKC